MHARFIVDRAMNGYVVTVRNNPDAEDIVYVAKDKWEIESIVRDVVQQMEDARMVEQDRLIDTAVDHIGSGADTFPSVQHLT